jgi:ribosomal protein S18 acetylase RimI-like enzyme
MTPTNISRAISEDAAAIARVQVRSWQAAYEGIVPADYLAALTSEKREAVWREFIPRGEPELLVARDGESIVGFIAFGLCRDENAAADRAEVWAIYVAPSHWAQGVGSQLYSRARARLIDQGYQSVGIWVLTENTRAIQFYARVGFTADDDSAKEVVIGGKPLKEIRYVAQLND